jgi:hypothetical protein
MKTDDLKLWNLSYGLASPTEPGAQDFRYRRQEMAMAETKSAAEQFAEQQAREAISRRYIDPATLDPDRQELIDKNRILGEYTFDYAEGTIRPERVPAAPETSLVEAIRQRPLQAMVLAAAIGVAVALISP